MNENYHEDALVSLRNVIARHAMDVFGVSERSASEFARLPVDDYQRRYGGRRSYLPTVDRKKIRMQARIEFNGTNYAELAVKFGRSERTIRRWVG